MSKKATSYAQFRANQWEAQGGAETYANVNFGNNTMADGSPMDGVYLQPKLILFYKDIWHCRNSAEAKIYAIQILTFHDVDFLEFNRTWLWVNYRLDPGATHLLPGQKQEDRKPYRGR